jgi:hypothetical protein
LPVTSSPSQYLSRVAAVAARCLGRLQQPDLENAKGPGLPRQRFQGHSLHNRHLTVKHADLEGNR